MHEMPSVIYDESYKRRGKPWEKGLLGATLLLDRRYYVRVVTTNYSEFGEVEDFREGTLEPKSALLYQLLHSSIVQLHCSSWVRGEEEYPRSRLGGQPVGHCIRIMHVVIHTRRWPTTNEDK